MVSETGDVTVGSGTTVIVIVFELAEQMTEPPTEALTTRL